MRKVTNRLAVPRFRMRQRELSLLGSRLHTSSTESHVQDSPAEKGLAWVHASQAQASRRRADKRGACRGAPLPTHRFFTDAQARSRAWERSSSRVAGPRPTHMGAMLSAASRTCRRRSGASAPRAGCAIRAEDQKKGGRGGCSAPAPPGALHSPAGLTPARANPSRSHTSSRFLLPLTRVPAQPC